MMHHSHVLPCMSGHLPAVPQCMLSTQEHGGSSGEAFSWRSAGKGGFVQGLGVCLVAPDVPWPHNEQVRCQETAGPRAPESCKVMRLKWCCVSAPEPLGELG